MHKPPRMVRNFMLGQMLTKVGQTLGAPHMRVHIHQLDVKCALGPRGEHLLCS